MSLENSKILSIIKKHLRDYSIESSEAEIYNQSLSRTRSSYIMRYDWFKKSKKESLAYDEFIDNLKRFENQKDEIYLVRFYLKKEKRETVYFINYETEQIIELPLNG
jgi:hypothetical protein